MFYLLNGRDIWIIIQDYCELGVNLSLGVPENEESDCHKRDHGRGQDGDLQGAEEAPSELRLSRRRLVLGHVSLCRERGDQEDGN